MCIDACERLFNHFHCYQRPRLITAIISVILLLAGAFSLAFIHLIAGIICLVIGFIGILCAAKCSWDCMSETSNRMHYASLSDHESQKQKFEKDRLDRESQEADNKRAKTMFS